MNGFRVLLAVVSVVAGVVWLVTANYASECASSVGVLARMFSQRTAHDCAAYSFIHGFSGVVALSCAVGFALTFARSRPTT